jgi:hypothetical protein
MQVQSRVFAPSEKEDEAAEKLRKTLKECNKLPERINEVSILAPTYSILSLGQPEISEARSTSTRQTFPSVCVGTEVYVDQKVSAEFSCV